MRRFLLFLYFVLLATISFSQNEIGNTFYVYRNDGAFNAFYSSEVDSITYSCIDKDSIEHENIVTQEIWTCDSIYRISFNNGSLKFEITAKRLYAASQRVL